MQTLTEGMAIQLMYTGAQVEYTCFIRSENNPQELAFSTQDVGVED